MARGFPWSSMSHGRQSPSLRIGALFVLFAWTRGEKAFPYDGFRDGAQALRGNGVTNIREVKRDGGVRQLQGTVVSCPLDAHAGPTVSR